MKKMLHSRKGRLAMKLREERERERERKQRQEGCKKMNPRK
jgi:hypothetical protein